MKTNKEPLTASGAWNASLLALVVFLAAMLYVFGTAMSGDTTGLTASIKGARIIDNTHSSGNMQ